MAEPDNSDTVTEDNKPTSRPVPVKASPLQKSFLERRKAREGAAKAGGGAEGGPAAATKAAATDADGADAATTAGGRLDPWQAAPGTRGATGAAKVRRSATDPDQVKKIGLRVLAGVALVAVVVVATLFGIGKYRYDQREQLRAEYAAFAEQVTVNLTTLTPSNVDRLQKTLLDETSGYAKQQMEQAVGQTVALVKQGQMSTKTTVLSTAVTRADPDRGSAIMVFGWTSTPKDPKQETAVETYRWRVDMTRINGQLKLTNFEWVW